jgi:hypothetical protein
MTVPLDGIMAIHNAFRKDIASMDMAADAAAHAHGNLDLLLKRYNFLNEVLVWHANGEEEYVFPALEQVAPLVAEAYVRDHRGLDSLFESLNKVVNGSDLLATARATAAFDFFLNHHLDSEEAHLYRIFNEKVSLPNQGAIMGQMAQKIPQDRFPEVVSWLYPLIGSDDRENITRIWQQALPKPAFTQAIQLVKSAIGEDWV